MPTVMPRTTLAAIMTSGISWNMDVPRTMKPRKSAMTDTMRGILRPNLCRTTPAIMEAVSAPRGGALAVMEY